MRWERGNEELYGNGKSVVWEGIRGKGEEWYGKGVWYEEGRGEIGTYVHCSMANLDDRDPVKPHVEHKVGKESGEVVREEVEIQTDHTPTLEIQDNLRDGQGRESCTIPYHIAGNFGGCKSNCCNNTKFT